MSPMSLRLPGAQGQPLSFFWNGRRLDALSGDSVAEALLANGIRTLAWTRKSHRPMGLSGIYVNGVLARVDGVPNVRLDQCPVRDGMRVEMQNCWPSPRFDLLQLSRALPARWIQGGFEHTNLVPSGSRLFQHWERLLAFLAGVAKPASNRRQVAIPPATRMVTEVLVIGTGRSGCEAANAAAQQGKTVVLVTRDDRIGRAALNAGRPIPELDPRVQCLFGIEVFGAYREGELLVGAPLDTSRGAIAFAATQVILATGRRAAVPLVGGAWLPGVMDARTALALATERRIAPGLAVAVVGDDDAQDVANRLRALAVNVVLVGDVQRLRRIQGHDRVRSIHLQGNRRCDAVVFAGPTTFDDSLSFQGGAQGRLQLRTGADPFIRVGSASLDEQRLPPPYDASALLCPCFDVSAAEVDALLDQGIQDLEVIKRLTSCGMGPCQGQPCWHSLREFVAWRLGTTPERLSKPSLRPPRRAITVAQAAGLADVVEPLQ
ncbi:2Fe-2S iron-sulfur cluster-binding protein [Pseudomonas oryzihabitans]|uniref:Sarcosine oxidase subunit alpha n=1 Tax=Pseudomonas oryzihabitans TaxID=47885 RepID=A0AAJ2BLB1_9PSED|nr:2Fe-2S iron-sulfur cluster-binding protein [Pseudomonas psychrotolerans]MDR6236479.1 sarcosine oxidase subunit alpha [Pseudomonas psychrotolerans]MDR6354142.1 sarcosine oxidase subunit alpha [Pseudomonas psychrotolerans]